MGGRRRDFNGLKAQREEEAGKWSGNELGHGAFRTRESRECLDRDTGAGQDLGYQP